MSTVPVPVTNTAIPVSFGVAVANQLNQQSDYLSFVPAGSVSTPAAGTATWVTLGNLTVPAWATKARFAVNMGAIAGSAVGATAVLQLKLGSIVGTGKQLRAPNGTTRFNAAHFDLLTGISTGTQTLLIQATFSASQISADASSNFDAIVDYLG